MHQQRVRNGTYILQKDLAKVNGKDFWIQDRDNDKNVIWFQNNSWNIGSLEDIGRGICGVHSVNNASELHKVTSWKYYKGDGEWVLAPTNDLQVRGRMVENVIGNVHWFNYVKGFGFIKRQDNNAKIFVHESSHEESTTLGVGDNVRFDIDISDKGYEATNVRII